VQAALRATRVVSYASTGSNLFVSADRHTTFGLIYGPQPVGFAPDSTLPAVRHILSRFTIAGAHFAVTGTGALESGGGGSGPSVLVEALVGGIGALIVLAIVFGSFLALVPIVMAIVAIPTTFLLIWGLTRVTDVSFIVEFLVALIGLGIAIDYSLLIVMRWREERAHGLDNTAAVQRAMETAGTAVIFSGTTVAVGLLALVVLPLPFLRSVGYGGMLIPLVSVLVATTLLPVVLKTVGPRIDWPRRTKPRTNRFWTAWGALVVRRRWLTAGLAVVILAALALPAFSLNIGDPKANSLATAGEAYQGLSTLERSGIGPGALNPFEIVVTSANPRSVALRLGQVPGVRGAVAPNGSRWQHDGTSLVVALPIADGSSSAGRTTLDRVLQAARAEPGSVRVGGAGAENADFISAVYGSFPLMIGLIVLVTFVLLARAFRSILLPLKAVVLVLVSVVASWGILVLVWQDGFGSQAIWGIQATGSITSFVPLMVFAFLFGISMDYEVFILARMREEYNATGRTNAAVVRGIGTTGRLVTSAALILFLAFAALGSGPETTIKIFATGLAAGVLLDATVVRMLLVPALVSLFGRWNWWLPSLPARFLRVQPSHGAAEQSEADDVVAEGEAA
jgi:RND superfamily putative drug exporter